MKKITFPKKPFFLIICCILFISIISIIFYITHIRSGNNTIKTYTYYGNDNTNNSYTYLKSKIKNQYGTEIYKYNKLTSRLYKGLFIITTNSDEVPGFEGLSESLPASKYIIYKSDNTIYFYGSDEATIARAIDYFLIKLVDNKGTILINNYESFSELGFDKYQSININQIPISEYSIYYKSNNDKQAAELLQYYINSCSGTKLEIIKDANQSSGSDKLILKVTDSSPYADGSSVNSVEIASLDNSDLENAVYLFANQYLGWYYAGTVNEHFNARVSTLNISIDNTNITEPWMPEREPIICLWNTESPRGYFTNEATSLMTDICSFSEDQLYDYVRMMKYCGYTGIQVTDICSAWSGGGGYENVQDKIRTLFNAAHSLNMHTTLWVWGAQFDNFGWTDNDTSSIASSVCPREDPDVYALFDKYYSIYAQLADCTDRLIAHYYDPGQLNDSDDIAFYAALLRNKFKAINPNVDFGINCWGDKFNKSSLVKVLGNDITIYEGTGHNDEAGYDIFRSDVASLGTRLGTWSWYNCEMEIDQLAYMCYNADIIKETYQTARSYDDIYKSDYIGEMDSYHVLNIFSLYCASLLSQNPDLDTVEVTMKVSESVVGPDYATDFANLLLLIQKARSGYDWSTFFWDQENYILMSDDYPYEEILKESEKALELIDKMLSQNMESYEMPLPIKLTDLLTLIKSHIQQINDFANFKAEFDKLKKDWDEYNPISDEASANIDQFTSRIYAIGNPIPDYNCIIGTWGQPESRAQRNIIISFCVENGLDIPVYGGYDNQWKKRLISWFGIEQYGKDYPVYQNDYQYGYALNDHDFERITRQLVDDGTLSVCEQGLYLTNWKDFSSMTAY